jgi:hypothetical protein
MPCSGRIPHQTIFFSRQFFSSLVMRRVRGGYPSSTVSVSAGLPGTLFPFDCQGDFSQFRARELVVYCVSEESSNRWNLPRSIEGRGSHGDSLRSFASPFRVLRSVQSYRPNRLRSRCLNRVIGRMVKFSPDSTLDQKVNRLFKTNCKTRLFTRCLQHLQKANHIRHLNDRTLNNVLNGQSFK